MWPIIVFKIFMVILEFDSFIYVHANIVYAEWSSITETDVILVPPTESTNALVITNPWTNIQSGSQSQQIGGSAHLFAAWS